MIICFSGTGNSAFTARHLSARLGDGVVTIDRRFYDHPRVEGVDNGRIIWVFPIYSWGVPPVVARVIKNLEGVAPGTDTWMVATCGDDAGLADKMWRRLVETRGMNPHGAFTVEMPNTYVTMAGFKVDDPAVAAAKIERAVGCIENIAEAIASGENETRVVRGSFAWFKTTVIYPWFTRRQMSPRHFNVSDACTGCGLCSRRCPLSNIEMVDHRPRWSTTCAFCLECFHCCPTHAVDWKHTAAGKEQYPGHTKLTSRRR